MIVVEGPDGSGKTTLAKHLCEKYDLEYTRYEGLSSTSGPDEGIWQWWQGHLMSSSTKHRRLVFDRCAFISELMYQPVSPGRPLVADEATMMQGINDLWGVEPLQLIFCLPPWETSERIIKSEGRDSLEGLTRDGLRKVHWAYHSLYALWNNSLDVGVVAYDFTKHDEFSPAIEYVIEGYLEGDFV